MSDLTAKSYELIQLVDYQEGTVVSREIIAKKQGTVTLFAFDKDQGLSEHTAPFDALVYCLDGEVEIIISGETHLVKQGETIIMPANRPHALKTLERFKNASDYDPCMSAPLSLLAKTLPSTLRHRLRTDKDCAGLTKMKKSIIQITEIELHPS